MNNMEKLDLLVENYHKLDKRLEVVATLLEQHLQDDTNNLGKIVTSLENIDKTLLDNTKELAVHIEGVRQSQENNRILREELNIYKQEVESKLKQLEEPRIVIKGILWLLGVSATIIGIIVALKELF